MTWPLQLALVLSLLALAAGIAARTRDPLHPGTVLAAQWALIGSVYLTLPHGMRPLQLDTVALVIASAAMFALASLAVPTSAPPLRECRSTALRPLLFWIALLGLPLFAWKAKSIADSIDLTDSMFINLRIALTGEEGSETQTYGVLAYLLPVSFTSTLVELAASKKRGFTITGFIALAVSLAYAVLATGRTYLFLILIALAFVALLQRRIGPWQLVGIGLASGAVIFFGLGLLLNKIGNDSVQDNALGAVEALGLYLLGSLAAFDLSQLQTGPLQWGLNVFRSVLAAAEALGSQVTVVPLVKEYVYVPEPTNVYTVFLPYVRDYGAAGALAFMALFGYLHARLYRAANSRDPRLQILYALGMYPLLMQFFQDQYFSLLTTWVVHVVLVLGCFRRVPGPWRAAAA